MNQEEIPWKIQGDWVEGCGSPPLCPGYFDSPFPRGSCEGMFLLAITEGNYGNVDLSGLKMIRVFQTPEGNTFLEGTGNWKSVLYVDTTASGSQADALESVFLNLFGYQGPLLKVKRREITYTKKVSPKSMKFTYEIPDVLKLSMRILSKDGRLTCIQDTPIFQGKLYVGRSLINELKDDDLGREWNHANMSATYCEFVADGRTGFVSIS